MPTFEYKHITTTTRTLQVTRESRDEADAAASCGSFDNIHVKEGVDWTGTEETVQVTGGGLSAEPLTPRLMSNQTCPAREVYLRTVNGKYHCGHTFWAEAKDKDFGQIVKCNTCGCYFVKASEVCQVHERTGKETVRKTACVVFYPINVSMVG